MKLRKSLLALGTLATIAAPVAAVVSCGSDSNSDSNKNPGTNSNPGSDSGQSVRKFNLLPTYTGQADQLIALGIHADYYPEQLNVDHPYSYLTNPGQFMTQQDDTFKNAFKKSLEGLMPATKGVSWWNQDAKESDDHRISNTYWQKQQGSVLLYEHYLLDDDAKVIQSAWAPKHYAQTAIQTNFRASRDPYTRIPKGVFFGWDLADSTIEKLANNGSVSQADIKLAGEGKDEGKELPATGGFKVNPSGEVVVTLNGKDVTVDQESAKIIRAMRQKHAAINSDGTSDWFYNDWFFVDSFHRTYLDNKDFQNSHFVNWMLDSTEENPFEQTAAEGHTLATDQSQIKALFDASTFQGDEVKAGLDPHSRAKSAHHPIYEQQEGTIGAAPMFEGAMRDNQLYLFNVAWQISNLAKTGTPYGEQYVKTLPAGSEADTASAPKDFSVARTQYEANKIKDFVAKSVTASQLEEMKNALTNADTITDQLQKRMAAMKEYFKALGVNGKTFGLMTIAPGKGVSTLQTMSKYSFIYKELGFAQPTPKSLPTLAAGATKFTDAWNEATGVNAYLNGDGEVKTSEKDVQDAVGAGALFNMDDNGWFWTLGEAGALDADRLDEFKDSIDLGVVASRKENFEAEVSANSGIQENLAEMFKGYTANSGAAAFVSKLREHADYDLWNEGLKTPFVMDMLLDQIMTKSEEYYLAQSGNDAASLKALQIAANKYSEAKSWGDYFTKQYIK